jgi:hypothetical protein
VGVEWSVAVWNRIREGGGESLRLQVPVMAALVSTRLDGRVVVVVAVVQAPCLGSSNCIDAGYKCGYDNPGCKIRTDGRQSGQLQCLRGQHSTPLKRPNLRTYGGALLEVVLHGGKQGEALTSSQKRVWMRRGDQMVKIYIRHQGTCLEIACHWTHKRGVAASSKRRSTRCKLTCTHRLSRVLQVIFVRCHRSALCGWRNEIATSAGCKSGGRFSRLRDRGNPSSLS